MIVTSTPLPISNFTFEFPIVNIFTQYSLIHYVLSLLSISNLSSHSPKANFFLYPPSGMPLSPVSYPIKFDINNKNVN